MTEISLIMTLNNKFTSHLTSPLTFFMHKIAVTQGHPSYKNRSDPGNKSEAVLRVIVPGLSVATYSTNDALSNDTEVIDIVTLTLKLKNSFLNFVAAGA